MPNSLRPHGLQHARSPWPSPTPGVYSNMSIELMMPSNHLILCRPLLLLPSIFPSIGVFSNESARQPKDWSFSFSTVLPMHIQGCFPEPWLYDKFFPTWINWLHPHNVGIIIFSTLQMGRPRQTEVQCLPSKCQYQWPHKMRWERFSRFLLFI